MIRIRFALCALAAASLLPLAAPVALAQNFPKGPITLVIPLAPGDAADIGARTLAEDLGAALKVPIVPVNRPGAAGVIGADSVAKAPKDGHTLLFGVNASLTYRRVLDPQTVAYDPTKDLTSLGMAMRTPSVLVVAGDAPFKDFRGLIEHAKNNPGKVRIGTAGSGSVGDFCVGLLNSLTGAELVSVPFKGAAPAVAALRGGHIEGVVLALGALSPHLRSGAMRGMVISSRFPEFPGIPTLAELGYPQNLLGIWLAFFAPAGIPAEATRALVPAVEKAVKNPAAAERLAKLGIVLSYAPPAEVVAEIREEHRVVEALARKTGLIK